MLNDPYLGTDTAFYRLYKEYKKHGSLCIGFDFDGTVHDFHGTGASYPAMEELLRDLKEINCRLICWSCYRDHAYISKYLTDNNIPFDGINTDGIHLPWETRKPFFSALLDDRAGLRQVYWQLRSLVWSIKSEKNDNNQSTSDSVHDQ